MKQYLATWQEPTPPVNPLFSFPLWMIASASGLATIFFLFLGWYQKNWSFYLAGATIPLAAFTLTVRQQKPVPGRTIAIGIEHIVIDGQEHLVDEFGGFWLQMDQDIVVVNLEKTRPGMFPTTVLFDRPEISQARELFLQILPEVEGR